MPRKYLIAGLLPANEVSLLVGPSGSNKTTWLFQMLEEWASDRTVLGKEAHPCPFVYVSLDRSRASATETMERVRVSCPIPFIAGVENDITNLDQILAAARKEVPDVRFLIIDGFATLTPQGKVNDYFIVAKFLRYVTRWCSQHGVTILGIMHAAKTKENEKYLNPRERILGSVAWAGFTDTIFFISPISPDNVEDPYRLLEVLPRNAAQINVEYQLDGNGMLITSQRRATIDNGLTQFLNTVAVGEEFTVEEFAANVGVRKTKAYSILKQLIGNDAVKKVKNGVFVRTPSQFLPN